MNYCTTPTESASPTPSLEGSFRVRPDDWEPKPHERQWFRHMVTGDKGYLIRQNGKDMIRLDRPQETNPKVYRPTDWVAEHQDRPLTMFHVAQICFAADKQFRFFTGEQRATKENWLDLNEEKRRLWMERGPLRTDRADLYRAIKKALEPLTK